MALLTCNDVSFAYEGTPVLTDVTFSVSSGDYLCIIGENGSGKSTLVKGLLHLKAPSGGTITTGDGLKHNEIGYLPQQSADRSDFPASVWEVTLSGRAARLGLRPFYNRADKEAAMQSLRRLGIEELQKQPCASLSGGQRQRLAIARALMKKADLYIFDDSFSALDFKTDAALRHALKTEVADAAVLIVAQRINTILNADQIIVLDEGKIAGIGKHSELMQSCLVYQDIARSQMKGEA